MSENDVEQRTVPHASGSPDSGSRDPWCRILVDPRLDRARSKLSIHELRLIVNHVRADNAEQDAAMVDEVLQARAENERLREKEVQDYEAGCKAQAKHIRELEAALRFARTFIETRATTALEAIDAALTTKL